MTAPPQKSDPSYTFDDYNNEVQAVLKANPNWRVGQAYFNVLFMRRPDLSEQVRTTKLDSFYDDDILMEFFSWLESHWDQ